MTEEITDQAAFAEFRERAPAVVEAHGGRFLVRGGRRMSYSVVQGDWTPHRVIVIEFESVERATSWWNSAAHTELRAIADRCSNTATTIVEGV